ncbi:hypothetical protein WJX77_007098 [Trebouxia sp. C0004]
MQSLYGFLVLFPDGRSILQKVEDFSAHTHSGEFLASETIKVLKDIGPDKFIAIVTDNAANMAVQAADATLASVFRYFLYLGRFASCKPVQDGCQSHEETTATPSQQQQQQPQQQQPQPQQRVTEEFADQVMLDEEADAKGQSVRHAGDLGCRKQEVQRWLLKPISLVLCL